MKHRYYFLPFMLPVALGAHSELVINEIMQSNIDCIMDDANEFPDSWVELYNSGDAAVDLSAYRIGVKTAKKAWPLPSRTVNPGEYVVVWCDKAEELGGLHTDFRLDSGKDSKVYLFRNGDVVDCIEGLAKQPAPNIAYGRVTDGADVWGYQAVPTPGSANTGKVCDEILPEPVFSVAGRVSSEPFTLSISVPDNAPAGTVVRYTVDGREPTRSSRGGGEAIAINSTTTVRAVLMCDGYLSPRSTTQSYIFLPREMTLPVISMVTDRNYFFDRNTGIYVDPNYKQNWRRPVNVELFAAPGEEAVINQLCETRIKGGASRDAALKSMVLYANKRFGTKRLEYEFFPGEAPGLTDWKSMDLRNAGNDFDYLYFRDAVIQRMMGMHTDLDWQPWQPAIFMLNGEYRGILNIRPRSNEDHIYTFYDGLEDIDMFENWWELKEGTRDNLDRFTEFYNQKGHTLEEYEEWMDTREFANLMIMNLIYDNRDFPGNNIVMWRPVEGGRWRWIAKDTDFGLGLYGKSYAYNNLEWIYDPDYDKDFAWANKWEHTRLFRRLMDIDAFREDFIDRCAVYMGDFLNARVTNAELDRMYSVIRHEYPHHRKLFNEWWPNYSDELSQAKRWMEQRVPYFYGIMSDFFKLGKDVGLTVDKDRRDDVSLTVNGIGMTSRYYDGRFFAGRRLHISASCADGSKAVTAWKVTVTNGQQSSTVEYPGSELVMDMPEGDSVAVSSVMGESGIEDIETGPDIHSPVEIYDISGRFVGRFTSMDEASLTPGIYIVRQGGRSMKLAVG